MIKFQLVCEHGHAFEGWFKSSAAYDLQVAAGQIGCPVCGSTVVTKAVVAPGMAPRRTTVSRYSITHTRAIECMRGFRVEVAAWTDTSGQRLAPVQPLFRRPKVQN